MNESELRRIAAALERLAPPPFADADLRGDIGYHWEKRGLRAVNFAALPLELIVGVDRQKGDLLENSRRHAFGYAAHDALLWGARGMGKSALVKSVVGAINTEGHSLGLIELSAGHLDTLPELFNTLASVNRSFVIFIDDIAFDRPGDGARMLRSMLEGGVAARPANVRLYVTSNRRNIIERGGASDFANERDENDDSLALADRFGLKLGFQYPDQAGYLAMVTAYANHFGLEWEESDALAFAHHRGGRSGRNAWHYAVELAGRAGHDLKTLDSL
jgi:uncharacterized protein